MNHTNGFGVATHTLNHEMGCYDLLPDGLRKELRNSPFNYSSPDMILAWRNFVNNSTLPEELLIEAFVEILREDIQEKLRRFAV